MNKILLLISVAIIATSSIAGADLIELSIDSGDRENATPTYANPAYHILGNRFEVPAGKSGTITLEKIRIFTTNNWPDSDWDGFYLSVYEFDDYPGQRIWPTWNADWVYFTPTGTGWGWYDYEFGSVFELEVDEFLVAVLIAGTSEDCDPIGIDDNDEFAESSWVCYGGSWTYYDDETDYRNLMIRVVIDPPAFSENRTNNYLRVRSVLE